MRRAGKKFLLVSFLLVLTLAGGAIGYLACEGFVPALPNTAERITLISIDGTKVANVKAEGSERSTGEELLHHYPVLGKTVISDSRRKAEVMAAIKKSIRSGWFETGAHCFLPRHVVRIEDHGKTTDLVICFECKWYDIMQGGNKNGTGLKPIGTDAQQLLNRILIQAQVPLAPGSSQEIPVTP
jgi:hypothetical protein